MICIQWVVFSFAQPNNYDNSCSTILLPGNKNFSPIDELHFYFLCVTTKSDYKLTNSIYNENRCKCPQYIFLLVSCQNSQIPLFVEIIGVLPLFAKCLAIYHYFETRNHETRILHRYRVYENQVPKKVTWWQKLT